MVNIYLPPSKMLPSSQLITEITTTNPMVVTVNSTNSYVIGMVVHFSIPDSYGMWQLNGLSGKILAISGRKLFVDIDATWFDKFSIPSGKEEKPAMLTPGGSRNIYNFNQTPFRSEDNTGN